jgi:hypothetical protein
MSRQRAITRRLVSRNVFRDEKGRFVKKADAIRQGIMPTTQRFYEYRNAKGKRVSARFAKKQKQKIVTITQAGDMLRRESATTARQVSQIIEQPSWQTIQSQQFRSIFNDAASRGVKIGVQFNDVLYNIPKDKLGDLMSFFTEMEYEYIRIFEPLTGGVYLQMLHAESANAELFDFDSLTTAPIGIEDEELRRANEEFQRNIRTIWRRYFG